MTVFDRKNRKIVKEIYGTDPVQQKNSTFIHVEMSFDALGLGIHMLLKAAANSSQFDCGQVQTAKNTATSGTEPLTGDSWQVVNGGSTSRQEPAN